MKVWREHFGFDSKLSDQMYKAIWSENSWLLVQVQLAATELEIADFTIMVHVKISTTITYEQNTRAFS